MLNEHDYIMRLIKQFTDALARVLPGKASSEVQNPSFEQLDELSLTFTDLSLSILRNLPTDQLIGLLSSGGRPDVHRTYMVGRLLLEDARAATVSDEAALVSRGSKALYLISKSVTESEGFLDDEHEASTLALYNMLGQYQLATSVYQSVFEAFFVAGKFGLAEDALSAILAVDPEAVDKAAAFYESLSRMSSEELVRGGLSRNSVEEGLRNFGG